MRQLPSIEIDKLRQACSLLLDEAERKFGSQTVAPADAYWNVDLRSAYTMAESVTAAIDAGSLSEDVDSMIDLLRRPAGEVVLWHDVQHIAALLRALAFLDLPPQ